MRAGSVARCDHDLSWGSGEQAKTKIWIARGEIDASAKGEKVKPAVRHGAPCARDPAFQRDAAGWIDLVVYGRFPVPAITHSWLRSRGKAAVSSLR